MACPAAARGNNGTNELLVGEVIRADKVQVWFWAEHAVDVPLVRSVT
jgi:starvation-inducible DNA-binding protein